VWVTRRLRIRKFVPSDVDNLWVLYSDPEVMHFLDRPATSRAEIEDRILPELLTDYERYRNFGYWAAESRETGEFIGRLALKPIVLPADPASQLWDYTSDDDTRTASVGYRIRSSAWRQGYASEGAAELVRRAFVDLGLDEVWGTTMAVNTGSRGVMEKLGFHYDRTVHLQWDDPLPGTEFGEVAYRLSRSDFLAGKQIRS
jgi:RimJ/RimL family protein N-acetyltransferase